ncbi:UDP-glucose 4-epimerase [Desemzia incerta]|uniref:UDP-glucose 4-epimerase n=1 Tax=Desemzia incerta TaxID=82801 RepID=A0A1I5X5Z5_9LACT|nr:NAD-dependent epimerase/dehydratase family protein [Desemzia incerta]SFQ27364.1 UDP-glucose 4-epimerase [Desemzia incerta]
MKKILITGKNSYVGNSVEKWLLKEPDDYKVDKISLRNDDWKYEDFYQYDSILHVAGIAHVSSDPKMEELYYQVNRDLTIEVANKAKFEGVKQFIFMSSIIVYGDSSSNKRLIDKETIPTPSNFYGDSKLQAEEGIKHLESDNFKVVIVRPPMIYGKDSKGNYPRLVKLAKATPIFPDYVNERSMLYIDNLCEFLKLMVDNKETGLFFPQNAAYVKTSELVKIISEISGKRIFMTKKFNRIIRFCSRIEIINKVFGNLIYDKCLSNYTKGNYQIRSLRESIEMTESSGY